MSSIDVFMPTSNSGKYLESCLLHILEAEIPINRFIVVDYYSKDNTKQILENWAYRNNIILDFHLQKGKGIGSARQQGLNLVTTPIYASIDSDVYIPHAWYSTIRPYLDEPDVLSAQSWLVFGEDHNPMSKYYHWRRERGKTQWSAGCQLINKTLLDSIGGYNPHRGVGEDIDVLSRGQKMGYRIIVLNNLVAINPRTFTEELSHVYWWAQYEAETSSKRDIIKGFIRHFYQGVILFPRSPYLLFMLPLRGFSWLLGILSSNSVRTRES
jgi:glycosyltransferase involved in cell wall biosynthesis